MALGQHLGALKKETTYSWLRSFPAHKRCLKVQKEMSRSLDRLWVGSPKWMPCILKSPSRSISGFLDFSQWYHRCQNFLPRVGLATDCSWPPLLDFCPLALILTCTPIIIPVLIGCSLWLQFWQHLVLLWWVLNQDTICMKAQKGESGRQKASRGWSSVGGRPGAQPLRRNGAAPWDQEALWGENPTTAEENGTVPGSITTSDMKKSLLQRRQSWVFAMPKPAASRLLPVPAQPEPSQGVPARPRWWATRPASPRRPAVPARSRWQTTRPSAWVQRPLAWGVHAPPPMAVLGPQALLRRGPPWQPQGLSWHDVLSLLKQISGFTLKNKIFFLIEVR